MKFMIILVVATVVVAQFVHTFADSTDSSNTPSNNWPAMPPGIPQARGMPQGMPQGQGVPQGQGGPQGQLIRKVRQATTPKPTTTTHATADNSGEHQGHKHGHKH